MNSLVGMSGAITTSQKKWLRKPADYYPTPWECTVALMDFLKLPERTYVWEPACGSGDMSVVLEAANCTVLSTDLRHSGYGDAEVNFLTSPFDPGVDWIITNPPFSLAPQFISRSLSMTPNVAMLLKSDYWHAASRIGAFDEQPPAYVLALTWRPAFLAKERGKSPLMNVVWVVWIEGETDTRYRLLRKPSVNWASSLIEAKDRHEYERMLGYLAVLGHDVDNVHVTF